MKELIGIFLVVLFMILVAATSEARGSRAFHEIPKDHRHKSAGRCLTATHQWIRGCR